MTEQTLRVVMLQLPADDYKQLSFLCRVATLQSTSESPPGPRPPPQAVALIIVFTLRKLDFFITPPTASFTSTVSILKPSRLRPSLTSHRCFSFQSFAQRHTKTLLRLGVFFYIQMYIIQQQHWASLKINIARKRMRRKRSGGVQPWHRHLCS